MNPVVTLLLQPVGLAAERPHACLSWDWPTAAARNGSLFPAASPWKRTSAQVEPKDATCQGAMLSARPDKTPSDRSHHSPFAHLFSALIPSFHTSPSHSAVWAAGPFAQAPWGAANPQGGRGTRPCLSLCVCSKKEMGCLHQAHLCTH